MSRDDEYLRDMLRAAQRAAMPKLSWREVIATRNALIHDIDGVHLIEVWNTAQRDLPALVSILEPLVGTKAHPNMWEGY
jgi:uncharacterized protein with HEPN domain